MSNNRKILLLSCLSNGSSEDHALADYLRLSKFEVFHQDCSYALTNIDDLQNFDLILLRNVWPMKDNKVALQRLANVVRAKNIKTYNPLCDNNFQEDKSYLVDLMQQGFPVIPTVIGNHNRRSLGVCKHYIIKPVDGCSSLGVEKIASHTLEDRDLSGYVVQPYINFDYEVSFYFIDGQYIHALRTRSTVDFREENSRWDLELWTPTKEQIEWARQFVVWNSLPYGFERIDAGQTANNGLVLMEIEDIAPFFSLDRLPMRAHDNFMKHFNDSLLKASIPT